MPACRPSPPRLQARLGDPSQEVPGVGLVVDVLGRLNLFEERLKDDRHPRVREAHRQFRYLLDIGMGGLLTPGVQPCFRTAAA